MRGNHSLSRFAIRSAIKCSSKFENSWCNDKSNRNRQSRITALSNLLSIAKVIQVEMIKDGVQDCNVEGRRL